MIRLKDRNMQIPNGIFFYLSQTRWRSKSGSFENVVQQLKNHLRGNPIVLKQLGWSTDDESLRTIVDLFNARVCEKMHWTDYYITDTGQAPPKSVPRNNPAWSASGAVVAGVNTLKDWFGDGMKPVEKELAFSRASVCAGCPKNDKNDPQNYPGDWTAYFTKPASAFITKQFERRASLGLATPDDEKIEVCMACLCPLKLKVWTPIVHIRNRMPQPVKDELDPNCWVLKEG